MPSESARVLVAELTTVEQLLLLLLPVLEVLFRRSSVSKQVIGRLTEVGLVARLALLTGASF